MNSSMTKTMKTSPKNNVKKVAPIGSYSNKAKDQDILHKSTNGVEDNTETSVKVEKNTKMLDETSANTQNVNEIESPEKETAAPCQSDTISDKSTSSVGSIEQRLAAMISPTKIVADLHLERNGKNRKKTMY